MATGHWLRAYAIGMKLAGVADTRAPVLVAGPGSASDPNTARCSPSMPSDFILVGGGAYTSWPAGNGGELRRRSFPANLNDRCWWRQSDRRPLPERADAQGIGG